jgi:hypothetical protein
MRRYIHLPVLAPRTAPRNTQDFIILPFECPEGAKGKIRRRKGLEDGRERGPETRRVKWLLNGNVRIVFHLQFVQRELAEYPMPNVPPDEYTAANVPLLTHPARQNAERSRTRTNWLYYVKGPGASAPRPGNQQRRTVRPGDSLDRISHNAVPWEACHTTPNSTLLEYFVHRQG